MAFIGIQSNQSISKEAQQAISDGIGKAVNALPNQSPDSILIVFDGDKAMHYRGDAPVALVAFRAFGNEAHTGYDGLTAQISRILHRTLGIETARIFVEFADISAFGVGEYYAQRQ